MQIQPATLSRKYINRENLEQNKHRCDVWYTVYPHAIHQLIADKKEKEVYGLTVVPAEKLFEKSLSELQTILAAFEYAPGDFSNAHVIAVDPRYTFVPDPLFESQQPGNYLDLIQPKAKWNSVHYDRIPALQMVDVYQMSDLFFGAARLVFPGANVRHYAGILAEAFLKTEVKTQKERLYVHFQEKGMDIFRYDNGRLVYHNYFPFEADTDIVYFILSVAEVMQFKSNQWEVLLSGNVASDNSLLSLMKKYIPHVLLLKRQDLWQVPVMMREIPEHQYFIESAGLLCAS